VAQAGKGVLVPLTLLQRGALPRFCVPHLPDNADAIHRARRQTGVAAQEQRVALGELARQAAIDLEDVERRLSMARR
jgi:hypothetical protein